jgi:hypothetical protein
MDRNAKIATALIIALVSVASALTVRACYVASNSQSIGAGSSQSTGISSSQPTGPCGAGAEISVNNVEFCALDVTADSEILQEGYTRLKQPVSYMGVTFTTSCGNGEPCGDIGCWPSNVTCVAMGLGVIKLNVAFPDGSNETIQGVIGDTAPGPTLSEHSNPRAGFEMQGPYGSLRLILLVQEQ